jgi:hypothetical protein
MIYFWVEEDIWSLEGLSLSLCQGGSFAAADCLPFGLELSISIDSMGRGIECLFDPVPGFKTKRHIWLAEVEGRRLLECRA